MVKMTKPPLRTIEAGEENIQLYLPRYDMWLANSRNPPMVIVTALARHLLDYKGRARAGSQGSCRFSISRLVP